MALGHTFEERELDGTIKIRDHRPKVAGSGNPTQYGVELKSEECPECGKGKTDLKEKLERKGYNMK